MLGASSILLAFTYWTGLAMASLLLLTSFNAAGARWMTLLRRQLELHASAIFVCAIAFGGLVAVLPEAYPWVGTAVANRAWLNPPGFLMRGAIAFVLFGGVSFLVERGAHARGISAGALFFLGLAMAACGVDWLMSLEPAWASAAFAAYWISGTLVSALALLLLTAIVPADANLPSARISNEHVATLAALLLAACCLWAWVAFTQGFVLLRAQVPADQPWLAARLGAWRPVALLLAVGRFALPVAALMGSPARRERKLLTALGVWTLTMQFVDLFWIIKPALRLEPEATFAWTDVTAWSGLGGLCVAFVVFRMRGTVAIPANDPDLDYSERYRQPMV